MLNLEKALSIYTDILNENKFIDLEYFKGLLSENDFEEFLELIKIINSVKSIKNTNEFDKIFSEIDNHKQNIYNIPQAANFRVCEDVDEIEILDKLDRIFEEEFGDE